MFTHSTTAPNRTCAMWPRQGQSQRLVSQCLQSLTTYKWIPFLFWKMSVYTSVGWWLQEPCLACRGHGSALSFNEKPPPNEWIQSEWIQPFYCSFPQHLEKAVTSRSINSLRGPLVTHSLAFPEECLLLSTVSPKCTLHLRDILPRHEPRDFN